MEALRFLTHEISNICESSLYECMESMFSAGLILLLNWFVSHSVSSSFQQKEIYWHSQLHITLRRMPNRCHWPEGNPFPHNHYVALIFSWITESLPESVLYLKYAGGYGACTINRSCQLSRIQMIKIKEISESDGNCSWLDSVMQMMKHLIGLFETNKCFNSLGRKLLCNFLQKYLMLCQMKRTSGSV